MKAKIIGSLFIGILAITGGIFARKILEGGPVVGPAGTASVYDTVPERQMSPILVWVGNATPNTKAVLDDAYGAFFANYATPLPAKPYLTAVSCTAKILDQGLRAFSPEEQEAFRAAYKAFYGVETTSSELFGLNAKAGTISPAVAAIVREYFAIRLRMDTTPELQSQVLERLVAAAGDKVEVSSFSKNDCAQLPVDKKYK